MGHSPSKRHKGKAQDLLTPGIPRICSHQQVDDQRKRENHTAEHTTKHKGKLEPRICLSCNQIYLHNPIHIYHPIML